MVGGKISLWRSEEMQLVQLMIPTEAAHDTIQALGEVGLLQFKDLNPNRSGFQRTYANQVKRCDEAARRLRYFKDQVDKWRGFEVAPTTGAKLEYNFDEVEGKLDELEHELAEVNGNIERLYSQKGELMELLLVLERAAHFMGSAGVLPSSNIHDDPLDTPLLESQPASSDMARINSIAGLIDSDKVNSFERLLFRATRGNVFLRRESVGEVPDPATGDKHAKDVYVVFYTGERAKTKILKICEAFNANRYPFPEDRQRQATMKAEVTGRITELDTTIKASENRKDTLLGDISQKWADWSIYIRREKAVFHTLNKLSIDVSRNVLVANAWVPVEAKSAVQNALRQTSSTVESIMQPIASSEQPPTYFKTSKFTAPFQGIVEAYGVARYREVNPAVFTIITFPFLFAVMFGDLGHGFLMFLYALALVLNEKALGKAKLDEIIDMTFGGRYIILLMGIFSMYTGLLYNETFSVPLNLFGSKYVCMNSTDADPCSGNGITENLLACASFEDKNDAMLTYLHCPEGRDPEPYLFGVDPAWHGTNTELPMLNSLKMKMSVIMGVTQMNLGIIMSFFNELYHQDWLSVFNEFIPEMLFLNSIFGYLVFLIVYKWGVSQPAYGLAKLFITPQPSGFPSPVSKGPPDLYHILIYMFLSPGDVDCSSQKVEVHIDNEEGQEETSNSTLPLLPGCPENLLFEGQGVIQTMLILVAVVCIPWLLFVKPCVLKAEHNKKKDQGYDRLQGREESGDLEDAAQPGNGGHGDGEEEEEFNFGEIFIHQMIHTIEFVLGAVSNTASYLRLWALSLAHSELSAVFYDMLLMNSLKADSAGESYSKTSTMTSVYLVIGYFVWILATLGVLMTMESLSAFLHALRLHWVEFQNKFYHGDGYKFVPFSFDQVDKSDL